VGKIDLKPADTSRVTLFANKAEAIVFWLSLAGLIFLAIVSVFRYYNNKTYALQASDKHLLLQKISQLQATTQEQIQLIDSLKQEIENSRQQISRLMNELDALQKQSASARPKTIAKKKTEAAQKTVPPKKRNHRDRTILQEFQIKGP